MKSKSRSHTKKARNVLDVVFFALQCSQRIGQWLTLLSILHIISTQIAVMVCADLHAPLGDILDKCIPYYMLGVSAYFGKAAIENVLKISKDLKSASTLINTGNEDKFTDDNG